MIEKMHTETPQLIRPTVHEMLAAILCAFERGWLCILLPVLLLVSTDAGAQQQEVRFGVLGLFHPRELVLEQGSGEVISIRADGGAGIPELVLNGEPGHRLALFRAVGDRVVVGAKSASGWTATARNGGVPSFRLTVPGKLHRAYRGRLTIHIRNGELVAVASLDRETAVASIVASEMDESAPIEALKAQAVATRSFLAAGARHLDFDFCDSTHCQFLKSPPPATSRVSSAVQATQDLVLRYRGSPLAAMYSSRCGGHTRSLRDVGMEPGEGYPYYGVQCTWCSRHPLVWRSRIGKSGPAPEPGDEPRRIVEARQWGWSAIPGNDFEAIEDGSGWQLEGHSVGHSLGMCQHGAVGMAVSGANFREILAHYYPNTSLVSQP
jgi:stage II sporulation protein D